MPLVTKANLLPYTPSTLNALPPRRKRHALSSSSDVSNKSLSTLFEGKSREKISSSAFENIESIIKREQLSRKEIHSLWAPSVNTFCNTLSTVASSTRKERDSVTEFADVFEIKTDLKKESLATEDLMIRRKIVDALRHLGNLELRRSNRANFISHRLDSPVKDIGQLREEMNVAASGVNVGDEQKDRAQLAGRVLRPNVEAFCGEHAYAMMDLLIKANVPSEQLAVIGANAEIGSAVADKDKAGERETISHAFLLYSKGRIDQNKSVQDHAQQELIVIDPWVSKNKVVELPANQSAKKLNEAFINHFYEAMGEMKDLDKALFLKGKIQYDYAQAFVDSDSDTDAYDGDGSELESS